MQSQTKLLDFNNLGGATNSPYNQYNNNNNDQYNNNQFDNNNNIQYNNNYKNSRNNIIKIN